MATTWCWREGEKRGEEKETCPVRVMYKSFCRVLESLHSTIKFFILKLILCRMSHDKHSTKKAFVKCLFLTLNKLYLFFLFPQLFSTVFLESLDLHMEV
jgi:hypothetical protein